MATSALEISGVGCVGVGTGTDCVGVGVGVTSGFRSETGEHDSDGRLKKHLTSGVAKAPTAAIKLSPPRITPAFSQTLLITWLVHQPAA